MQNRLVKSFGCDDGNSSVNLSALKNIMRALFVVAAFFATPLSYAHAEPIYHDTLNVTATGIADLGTFIPGGKATNGQWQASMTNIPTGPNGQPIPIPPEATTAGPSYTWVIESQKRRAPDSEAWLDATGTGAPKLSGQGNRDAAFEPVFNDVGDYEIKFRVKGQWWSGTGEEYYRGTSPVYTLTQTVVNVKHLEYRRDGVGEYVATPGTLYVPIGQSVDFKAIRQSEGTVWPANKPAWSAAAGVTGATGVGAAKSFTFAEPGSKSVAAEAGNTIPANIAVVKVDSLTVTGAVATAGDATCFVSANAAAGNQIVVKVVLNPAVAAGDLPANFITWTGGQAGANQFERLVPKNAIAATTVTATIGTSSKAVTIHVVNSETLPATNTSADLSHTLAGPSNTGTGNAGLTVFTIGTQGITGPEFDVTAYLNGNAWRFRVTAIRHSYKLAINSQGRINIASGTDPTITTPPNSKAAVIADLTPPRANTGHGPPRTTYWSQTITQAHEQAHADRFYAAPFWETRMRTFETEVEAESVDFVCADDTTHTALAIVAARTAAAWRSRINDLHEDADLDERIDTEQAAHNVTNPMYTALINSIP